MANIFQKIFLSKNKLAEQEKRDAIMKTVSANPVMHTAYVSKHNTVVRRFSIKNNGYNIYSERICDMTRAPEQQIQYTLHIYNGKKVEYATHSTVDKFATLVYNRMRKSWEKSKNNAR